MGKNQAYKAMQRSRLGSTSAGPEEIEDGMVDGSFHSPEWHAARLASLKTTHTVTWEEFKKKQKEDALRKGQLEEDTDRLMREYRAQLDAERALKLAHGRNHSSKSSRKKDRKDREKDSKKRSSRSSRKRKRSRQRSSDSSSSSGSFSESSSSDDEERESRRSKSKSKKDKKRKRKSRNKNSRTDNEEAEGPVPLSRFFESVKS